MTFGRFRKHKWQVKCADLLLLVFLLLVLYPGYSETKDCSKLLFRQEKLRSSDQSVAGKTGSFYSHGQLPTYKFKIIDGKAVNLSCNHINYQEYTHGDNGTHPVVDIKWYKNGRPIFQEPRKRKIFGCKKRPLLFDTRLSILNASSDDEGVYSCRVHNATGEVLLTLNFTLYKERNETQSSNATAFESIPATLIPDASSELNGINVTVSRTSITRYGGGILVIVFLAVAIYLVIRCLRPKFQKKKDAEKSTTEDLSRKSSATSGDIEEEYEYPESVRKKLIRPSAIDDERYRQAFPIIQEQEWNLVKCNEVDRTSVHCDLEYSMPVVLGTGNFGHVYQGELTLNTGSRRAVAVKRLNDGYKPRELEHFLKEAITMLNVGEHENVLGLYGCILLDNNQTQGDIDYFKKPPILLLELASCGNLKNFLHERRFPQMFNEDNNTTTVNPDEIKFDLSDESTHVGNNITLRDLLSFSCQVACGMDHLARNKIVHRDLAARNVLLNAQRVIKIADFGLSKQIRNQQSEYYKIHAPTIAPAKWTAPEALMENRFSFKSDIWSYGVLLWEIFSMGETPYSGIPLSQLYRSLCSGLRLKKPLLATPDIYNLMNLCWNFDVDCRPEFSDLITYFQNQMTPNQELYDEHEVLPWNPNAQIRDSRLDSRRDSVLSRTSAPSIESSEGLKEYYVNRRSTWSKRTYSAHSKGDSDYFTIPSQDGDTSDSNSSLNRKFPITPTSPPPFFKGFIMNPLYSDQCSEEQRLVNATQTTSV